MSFLFQNLTANEGNAFSSSPTLISVTVGLVKVPLAAISFQHPNHPLAKNEISPKPRIYGGRIEFDLELDLELGFGLGLGYESEHESEHERSEHKEHKEHEVRKRPVGMHAKVLTFNTYVRNILVRTCTSTTLKREKRGNSEVRSEL